MRLHRDGSGGKHITEKSKILAVDDDSVTLDLLVLAFSDSEFDVVCVQDGAKGLLELEKTDGVVAILLDGIMPNMNGMQMLKALKADLRYNAIPVIMQSAVANGRAVKESIRQGADDYLLKPYSADEVLETVRAAVQRAKIRKEMLPGVKQ